MLVLIARREDKEINNEKGIFMLLLEARKKKRYIYILYDTVLQTHVELSHKEIYKAICKDKKEILGMIANQDASSYVTLSRPLFSNNSYDVFSFMHTYNDYQIVHMAECSIVLYKGYKLAQLTRENIVDIYILNNQWYGIVREYSRGGFRYLIGNDKVMLNYSQRYGSKYDIDYTIVDTFARSDTQVSQEIMLELSQDRFIKVTNLLDTTNVKWYNKHNNEVKKFENQKKASEYVMKYLKVKEPILNCQKTLNMLWLENQAIIEQYKAHRNALTQCMKSYSTEKYRTSLEDTLELNAVQGFIEFFNYLLSVKMRDTLHLLQQELNVLDIEFYIEVSANDEKSNVIIYPSIVSPDLVGMKVYSFGLRNIHLLEKVIE